MPSTAIRQFSYDPSVKRLAVTFVSGRRYVYEDVPPTVYRALRAAPSKGGFFNAEIRDRYVFHEVTDDRHGRKRSA